MYQAKYLKNEPKAPKNQRPHKKSTKEAAAPKAKKSTVLFYSIYGGCSLVLLIAIFCLMIPLRAWLVNFEASQPKQKCAEVFQQLFSQPDWASLYTMAGAEDTAYENKDTYAAYMQKAVGDTPLTYLETSAGLSGDRKYIVKAGDVNIATFTLANKSATDTPDWQLGKVEVLFNRSETVTVAKLPGQTVYINGVALDGSHTIRTISTLAENYLPEGVHGYRLEQQYVDGLLTQPEVTVKDGAGNTVPVTRDEQTGIYHVEAARMPEITDTESSLAIKAAETYAKFMIRAVSDYDLGKVFDTKSAIYKNITESDSYVQSYRNYTIDKEVKDYYRYTADLFSVRVVLNLHVTRTDGTIKEFEADNTYFFTKNASGNWLVTNMVNVNVQDPVEKVRLTFVHDGAPLASTLVSASQGKLTTPVVAPPEGKIFGGWVKEVVGENGSTTLSLMFTPDENGVVYLSGDTKLEPMTLYTLFKDAGGEQ